MKPTIFPYGRYIFLPFKPEGYKREFEKLSPDQIQQMNNIDHITTWSLLVIFVGYGIYYFSKKK